MCPTCACSKVLALARQLADLDTALQPMLARSACQQPAVWLESITTGTMQVSAACLALISCLTLAGPLGLQSSDAFRVGTAARLILNSGQAVLEILLGAHGSLQQQGDAHLLYLIGMCASVQLPVVAGFIASMEQWPEAAAALAATAAKPQVLLPWLATLTDAVLRTCPAGDRGGCAHGILGHLRWIQMRARPVAAPATPSCVTQCTVHACCHADARVSALAPTHRI